MFRVPGLANLRSIRSSPTSRARWKRTTAFDVVPDKKGLKSRRRYRSRSKTCPGRRACHLHTSLAPLAPAQAARLARRTPLDLLSPATSSGPSKARQSSLPPSSSRCSRCAANPPHQRAGEPAAVSAAPASPRPLPRAPSGVPSPATGAASVRAGEGTRRLFRRPPLVADRFVAGDSCGQVRPGSGHNFGGSSLIGREADDEDAGSPAAKRGYQQ